MNNESAGSERNEMSDVILHEVLCMPPELWGDDTMDKYQRYQRYLQASRRIEDDGLEIERLQARIDALMLEYCPDKMTPEQVAEWEHNQQPVSGEEQQAGESFPQVVSAEYDKEISRLAITLDNGLVFTVSPALIKGLENAHVEELLVPEISPSGYGIHFPLIDADFYIQALFAKGIRCGVNIGSKVSGNLNAGMNELEYLLGEYFDCGVREGREHSEHDTKDGAAQKALNAIRECVSRMILVEREAQDERVRHP